ncbi:MAG: multiheme c-type cytochrome [Bryobacteraceae bacterium]
MIAVLLPAVCLLASAAAAQPVWSPERFWSQKSEYAGSGACRQCHGDVYRKQEASHHARSLRPLAEVTEFTRGLPFAMRDRVGEADLSLDLGPSRSVVLTAKRGSEQAELRLDWAFGAGGKAVTPLGTNRDGRYVEGRVSWYQGTGTFDLTPGARERTPKTADQALGQVLAEEDRAKCFGCHTSRSGAPDVPPPRSEMGIRCERCHGPGGEHVRAAAAGDRRIFHPRSLDGFQMAQMCGVCHGRPPSETDFAEIARIQERQLTVRFPSQRLVLSRCFNETDGGLKCTACHDPHSNVPVSQSLRDAPCQSCHSRQQRRDAAVCPKATEGCSVCHMPRKRVVLHSEFSDHWIRVVRSAAGATR